MRIAANNAYSTVAAQANSIAVRASGTGAPFEKLAIVQLSPTPLINVYIYISYQNISCAAYDMRPYNGRKYESK